MYLELAENNNQGYYSQMAQAPAEDTSDLYLYVPAQFAGGEGMYVREDSFDLLPDFQWKQLQDVLAPYQERNLSLFGLGKKGRARRAKRREARQARKIQRMTVRAETGGGALGKIGDVVKTIFAPGGATGVPEEPITTIEALPAAPVKAAGFMGLPTWAVPVGLVALGLAAFAMFKPKRGRK